MVGLHCAISETFLMTRVAFHGHPSYSALERLVEQTTVLRDHLYLDSSKDKKGANNKVLCASEWIIKWTILGRISQMAIEYLFGNVDVRNLVCNKL